MNILSIVIIFAVMLLLAVYLYFYFTRIAEFVGLNVEKKKNKIIVGTITGVLAVCSITLFVVLGLVFLYIIMTSIVMSVINIFLRESVSWKRIYKSGIIPMIIAIIAVVYGYFNMAHVIETDYKIKTSKSIREEGYKIAMISDLHYSTTMNNKKLKKLCSKIEESNPDMVVLCGDIVDESTKLTEMKEALNTLGSIKSTYGTFYVYGNHDENKYTSTKNYTAEELTAALKKNKINILQDQIFKINNDFIIAGRDERSRNRQSSKELLSAVDKKKFILLLDHQPCEIEENDEAGADLQLSGHTHGGQIWPMGIISNYLGFNEINYGYKKLTNLQVIVSSGIAGWGYPVRTEKHSEYIVVKITKKG